MKILDFRLLALRVKLRMVKFQFNYKGKNFNLDIEKCDNYFSRARGLMFRKKSKPLLFIFGKQTKQAIHSFFCVPFIAIWLDGTQNSSKKNFGASKTESFEGDNIIDVKIVKPWKISVFPKEKFDKLLEIPINDNNFSILKFLIQK